MDEMIVGSTRRESPPGSRNRPPPSQPYDGGGSWRLIGQRPHLARIRSAQGSHPPSREAQIASDVVSLLSMAGYVSGRLLHGSRSPSPAAPGSALNPGNDAPVYPPAYDMPKMVLPLLFWVLKLRPCKVAEPVYVPQREFAVSVGGVKRDRGFSHSTPSERYSLRRQDSNLVSQNGKREAERCGVPHRSQIAAISLLKTYMALFRSSHTEVSLSQRYQKRNVVFNISDVRARQWPPQVSQIDRGHPDRSAWEAAILIGQY